jgi:hypothetical protein
MGAAERHKEQSRRKGKHYDGTFHQRLLAASGMLIFNATMGGKLLPWIAWGDGRRSSAGDLRLLVQRFPW